MKRFFKSNNAGFTLMETLLAITVVAILLSTFLAVFGPATSSIRRAISVQDADRLASALERELSTLRVSEVGQYQTAFDKAFQWISSSGSLNSAILLFNYRGDTGSVVEGELAPYTGTTGSPGEAYLVQSAVRRLGSSNDLQQMLEAVEGKVFAVRMRQLVPNSKGGLSPAAPGTAITNAQGATAANASTFTEAVIAMQAEFFLLPSNSFQYISGPLTQGGSDFQTTLGKPLFTRNMAVRR